MTTDLDMISATIAYEDYGIPRAGLRELAERGVVRSVERQLDICHTMRFYSRSDIERYISTGVGDYNEQ